MKRAAAQRTTLAGGSAIVTGGAQGIGKAIGAALVQAGVYVALLDRDRAAGRETAAELSEHGHAVFLHGDAADEAGVRDAVRAADELGQGLCAAVANTGIAARKPVTRLSLAQWNRVLAVNLTAGFLLAKHAAPALRRRNGAMVMIGSSRALMSEPDWEAYAATKGGVVALTHALAASLGPQVRVNCVSPGWVATDAWQARSRRREPVLSPADHAQHPAGRVGRPEDIAALVCFLLSPAAGFITGAHYLADGGMTRKMIYV
jgi:NAD(P)-dependent dehydrogenase (short-subunit alcohol dehydrogenase family)